MNPRETAAKLLDGFHIDLTSQQRALVIEAMIAGMVMAAADSAKKEREACAKIADQEYVSIQTVTASDGFPEEGDGECCAERCLIIRDKIRARANPAP